MPTVSLVTNPFGALRGAFLLERTMAQLTITALYPLLRAVKSEISDEYRAFQDDDRPGIQITIGTNSDLSEWTYQTGDNSFTGSAYFYPIWAVDGVYRDTNCRDLARSLIEQALEQSYSME